MDVLLSRGLALTGADGDLLSKVFLDIFANLYSTQECLFPARPLPCRIFKKPRQLQTITVVVWGFLISALSMTEIKHKVNLYFRSPVALFIRE